MTNKFDEIILMCNNLSKEINKYFLRLANCLLATDTDIDLVDDGVSKVTFILTNRHWVKSVTFDIKNLQRSAEKKYHTEEEQRKAYNKYIMSVLAMEVIMADMDRLQYKANDCFDDIDTAVFGREYEVEEEMK